MKLLLQHKIVAGYLLLMAVIGCMVAIVLHERKRVAEIEQESTGIFQTQNNINTAHRYITVLATFGESVMIWNDKDNETYNTRRLKADSLLQVLREQCKEFVSPEQVDSLRSLLLNKEEHLFRMKDIFRQQKHIDSLLANQYSLVTSQTSESRTVTRKKKGIAGFFGGKETVLLPAVNSKAKSRNNKLISLQEERQHDIETLTDSLRLQNRELNRKLRSLITSLDEQTLLALLHKEARLKKSYEYSTSIITGLIIFSIILLVVSYLIIQRDIREKADGRIRLEETIKQNTALLEMRKNIILTISHDIRAPLNIISGNAELAMDTREKKRRNAHLNNIRIICKHVVHLLNNLLDVYRLNEAKETRNDVPFNLNDLLERIASVFSHVVTNKGILFRPEFKNTDVNLYGDVDRIEQILDNLLTNAVKFTESGTIELNAHYHDGVLLLEVKDSGIGMSQETLSRIFRPFERLTSATNVDGVGLGLPITKGVVKLLGGKIDVTSDIGYGTTFRITLPLNITDEPLESENRILPHPEHLPKNVLVIDDDTMFLTMIKEMLERNGVSCTTCSNAKELVNEMRRQDYDLLLTDIQMPQTNGFEILALLRKSSIGNSHTIPIVAMTARGEGEKEAFIKGGFTDSIHKPFSMRELLDMISSVVSRDVEESHTPDFATFTADVLDKRELLRTFIIQSGQNMADLQSAIKTGDIEKLHDIVHQIKPSLELLRADAPLIKLRATLNDSACDKNTVNEQAKLLIGHISGLITEAEKEIKKMNDETEDTDS